VDSFGLISVAVFSFGLTLRGSGLYLVSIDRREPLATADCVMMRRTLAVEACKRRWQPGVNRTELLFL
jgi:hypothetical protein